MSVLVDTSLWSLSFRRRHSDLSAAERPLVAELAKLIREGRARMIGPIRQEILTGIRDDATFQGLRDDLRQYPDESLTNQDYEVAAEMSNRCRSAGVAGSAVDLLICAAASRRGWSVFTTDRDFTQYARHIEVKLHL